MGDDDGCGVGGRENVGEHVPSAAGQGAVRQHGVREAHDGRERELKRAAAGSRAGDRRRRRVGDHQRGEGAVRAAGTIGDGDRVSARLTGAKIGQCQRRVGGIQQGGVGVKIPMVGQCWHTSGHDAEGGVAAGYVRQVDGLVGDDGWRTGR